MDDAPSSRFRKLFDAVHAFVTEKGIEAHEETRAPRWQRFAHYWLLVLKSFARNKCFLRSTALAYTTLLALVPLFALTVSITTALLQEKGKEATQEMIERFVDAAVPQLKLVPKTPGQTVDARTEVVQNIHLFIANVESKTLGVTGMAGLVVVAIMLLGTIENTFNEIWGVSRGRNWLRRVAQYWAVISLGPILLAVAGALLSTSYLASSQDFQRASPWLASLVFKALPFVVVSLGFAVLYKMIPNTPVHWSAALIGGAMGGCLWVLLNLFNALNASRVMSMSKIYGTAMGLMPIFLVGLYFSWVILLFGAQVAYAHQNRQAYLQERKAEAVNQRGREYVALRVMAHVASLYARRQPPPTAFQLATELGVPSGLIGRVLEPLLHARLALEVAGAEPAYVPARAIATIACHDILQAIRAAGGMELETHEDALRARVSAAFESIATAEQAAASASLQDLLNPTPHPGPSPPHS